MAARTPYQDTSVPIERSKEQIREALRTAGARGGWRVSPEQRERQAWRALAWYLKTMLEAATFGLMRFEDVFLSFVESESGQTIGEAVIPMLEAGRLQLPRSDQP